MKTRSKILLTICTLLFACIFVLSACGKTEPPTEEDQRSLTGTRISVAIKGSNSTISVTACNEYNPLGKKVIATVELYSSSTYTEDYRNMTLVESKTVQDLARGHQIIVSANTQNTPAYWQGRVYFKVGNDAWVSQVTGTACYSGSGEYLGTNVPLPDIIVPVELTEQQQEEIIDATDELNMIDVQILECYGKINDKTFVKIEFNFPTTTIVTCDMYDYYLIDNVPIPFDYGVVGKFVFCDGKMYSLATAWEQEIISRSELVAIATKMNGTSDFEKLLVDAKISDTDHNYITAGIALKNFNELYPLQEIEHLMHDHHPYDSVIDISTDKEMIAKYAQPLQNLQFYSAHYPEKFEEEIDKRYRITWKMVSGEEVNFAVCKNGRVFMWLEDGSMFYTDKGAANVDVYFAKYSGWDTSFWR